ncbi:MAG: flagellin, partial [Lachnospiraceae bacterium]|nr:flagellin [Lachnospiraceae bacterium]
SGYKINSSRDNPAGYAISNKMHRQISGLQKANNNASNAINVIQTAEGAISEVQEMLHRMKELSIQSANGTNTSEDRMAIQREVDQLSAEITRIAGQTEYNTQRLLNGDQDLKGYSDLGGVKIETYNETFATDKQYSITFDEYGTIKSSQNFDAGSFEKIESLVDDGTIRYRYLEPDGSEMIFEVNPKNEAFHAATAGTTKEVKLDIQGVGGMKIQVGPTEGQSITIAIPELSLKNMGIEGLNVRTEEDAKKAIDAMDTALSYTSMIRSRLGAYQNRFEATLSNLNVTEENLTASYSTIKDVDMAEEMVEYTKLQILTQAGTSMLTQANEQPQQALQLLQ